MKAPFPYFGGKSKVASLIWDRFGNTPNYVEPFAGSLAVLLNRPHDPKIETVNDQDCYIANFWRAIHSNPAEVAKWADWPVNEADLSARHLWLLDYVPAKVRSDPDYFDAKIAGWWLWGICSWIGSGWCSGQGPWIASANGLVKKTDAKQPGVNSIIPHLGDAGMGINSQLPHLGNAGMGINSRLPHLGNAGRGINSQRPHLTTQGQGIHSKLPDLSRRGIHSKDYQGKLIKSMLYGLHERLRRVRVCCGDWSRVCTPCVTTTNGLTSVFLDPPYTLDADRSSGVYRIEDEHIGHSVAKWALENGNDPMMRIALCGYEGEYEMPGWDCVAWKANGGYSRKNTKGAINSTRERIWFSPHCLKPNLPSH